MFKTILIANRGEIACRVIKTARRLGIRAVAVYSDADRDALHVRAADDAVRIGPAPSAQSYLAIDAILAACKHTAAQAVHPGYGFLSENAEFAAALQRAGIVFIGPKPHAITAMGDKIASKKLAQQAGVNTIPGYNDVIENAAQAVTIAREIGYPVMLKASAGGGGKGMRIARNDAECREGFERATSEAKSAFGDGRVFAEKYIEQPRHIEIQVLADSHANVVYLNERECSIQRRHQKVIEEAPSPFLEAKTRTAMGEQAVALARAVQYQSAGTVEFVVDRERNFYFLEMNTRLQVEHPVTELITGLDLVELMIRIAAGEKLPFAQKDVRLDGWALEARVYAEDPSRDFLPSSGRLTRCIPPAQSACVRVDTGIEEGSEVSLFYDPMLAKLVAHGEDRDSAISRMSTALDQYFIRGVSHNLSFLNALIRSARFREGRLSTNLIAEEYTNGFHPADACAQDRALFIVVAAVLNRRCLERAAKISGQLPSHERKVRNDYIVIVGAEHHAIEVVPIAGGSDVRYLGESYRVMTDWQIGAPLVHVEINARTLCFQVDRIGVRLRLTHGGGQVDALVCSPRAALLSRHMRQKTPADLSRFLLSPMPGLLVRLAAKPGQVLKAGEEICVVEAMKMENRLCALADVTIKTILVDEGQSLEVDQPIVEFE
jgi:propionyl-CoA carboxylase alpha chain